MKLYSPEFFEKVREIEEEFRRRAASGPEKVFLDPIELIPTEPGLVTAAAEGNWSWGFYGLTPEVVKELQKKAKRKVLVVVFDTAARFDSPALKDFAWNELSRDFTGIAKDDPNDGHGLHVATCIAGTHPKKLDLGPATILKDKIKIAAAKVMRDAGWGYLSDIIEGTLYFNQTVAKMINEGWFVIYNYSLGSTRPNEDFKLALKEAEDLGVYISAAAGNRAKNGLDFPGAYMTTHGIGAIGPDGKKTPFSSYGGSLYRVAPGSRILGAYRKGFGELSGTSMASPIDAAMTAIWASVSPKATARQISHAGRYWAVDMDEQGWDNITGSGHANVQAFLKEDPTRFPDKDNGNPHTKNYEPAPEEEDEKRNLRNVEFELGTLPKIQWKAFGDGKFQETSIEMSGSFRTDLDADTAQHIARVQAAQFFDEHYLVLPKGSDLADAGWWATRWFRLELRRKGLNISIDQNGYWVHDEHGYKVRVTGNPTLPKPDTQGVYLGNRKGKPVKSKKKK